MRNIVATEIGNATKEINDYVTNSCPFCFDRKGDKQDKQFCVRKQVGKTYHHAHNRSRGAYRRCCTTGKMFNRQVQYRCSNTTYEIKKKEPLTAPNIFQYF